MGRRDMNPLEAFGACIRKYAVFEGRASRSEFWGFCLVQFIVSATILLAYGAKNTSLLRSVHDLLMLGLFLPGFAVTIRRLHDVGKSGALYVVPFFIVSLFYFAVRQLGGPKGVTNALLLMDRNVAIIYIALVLLLVLLLLPWNFYLIYLSIRRGDDGPNRFGEDPLGRR